MAQNQLIPDWLSIESPVNEKLKKGIITVGSAAFDALEGIANLFGLGSKVRKIAEAMNGVSEDDLRGIISEAVYRAKNASDSKQNSLTSELMSLANQSGLSQIAKKAIDSAIKKISATLSRTRRHGAEGDYHSAMAETLRNRAETASAGEIADGSQKRWYEEAKQHSAAAERGYNQAAYGTGTYTDQYKEEPNNVPKQQNEIQTPETHV